MVVFALLAQAQPSDWTVSTAVTAVVSAVAGLLIGTFGAYLKERGKQAAIHHEFDKVLDETRRTTEAVKQIELRLDQRNIVFQAEIAFRQRQLAEFYGPIYSSAKVTSRLWKLLMEGKMPSIRPQVMDLFRRQNQMIVTLLQSKFDLVEDAEVPKCFSKAATSMTLFNMGTSLGPENVNPPDVADLPEAAFPTEFFDYIVATTESLKAKLDELYKMSRAS